jgi:hypothetical protein
MWLCGYVNVWLSMWLCDYVIMWLLNVWICDAVSTWRWDYVTRWLCDCNCVTVWLCDYMNVRPCDCVTMWLCDYDLWLCNCVTIRLCEYVIMWLLNMWLCDGDYVTAWLCNYLTPWLRDYVTVTMLPFRPVAQRASSTRIGLTKVGLCTPATFYLMTNIKNVSEISGLTHYWSFQAPGQIPTQLPPSLTPSSLSSPTTLQYVCWPHISTTERVLHWPPASFKRPHPGPIITFYTYLSIFVPCIIFITHFIPTGAQY